MSTTIDQRVVEMQFDNQHFERNVATSLSTLNKLNQSLQLEGAAKGLEGINAAAKGINLSGISSAAETVGLKFSAMYTIADQALRNITTSAYNAGKRIVSALTIDPIKTGFQEYETQINAVQTILANTESKGTTIKDVNKALDELNTYADKTIYNFTEMTRNIGTFTAAGVDLDKSVKSIQGIANLAAVSGSTSQQASTAMYQLSQALAAGKVTLMDWNSVVNAGMGGQVFQDALKRTATAMGTNVDAIIKKYGSFRESLSKGEWLTADVLTKTLEQFTMAAEEGTEQWEAYKKSLMEDGYTAQQAEEILKMANTATNAATKVKTFTQLWDTLKESAQSGWTQTWEIIVGDFEEAKSLLTEVSDVLGGIIGRSAESRNAMLQHWKDLGGRTALIEGLRGAFEAIVSVVKPVKEAFNNIFPDTAEQKGRKLYDLTMDIAVFFKKLKLSDTASDNLRRTFEGLFAILDIVKQAFVAVGKAIVPIFGGFDDLGGGVLAVTAHIGDWLVKLDETIKKGDVFNKILQTIVSVVKMVGKAIGDFAKSIHDIFIVPGLEAFVAILDTFDEKMSSMGSGADKMKLSMVTAFEAMHSTLMDSNFMGFLKSLWDGVKRIGSGLAEAFGALTGGVIDKLNNADFSGLLDFINTLSLGGIGLGIAKFVHGFGDAMDSVGSFKEGVLDILEEAKGCFEAYQTQLKAGALMKIAKAIALLVGSLVVLSLVDSAKLSAAIGAITMLFAELMGSMAIFNSVGGNLKTKGIFKTITAMNGIATAVLILSFALTNIARMDFKQLAVGLVGIVGLTATLVKAMTVLGSADKTAIKGAGKAIAFALAIKILASACEDLSTLSWNELAKGLIGVSALMAGVSKFTNSANLGGKLISTALGMTIMAASLKIFASACGDFAEFDWDKLIKGMAGIGLVLLEVATFSKFTGNATNLMSTSVALIAIGAAMKIFASVIGDMSAYKWDEIGRGLAVMAGSLASVVMALKFMPKDMLGASVGMIAIGAALKIIADAFSQMAILDGEQATTGLFAISGTLAMLALALNAMTGTLPGSAALLVASAALAVMAPALERLGEMTGGEIAKSLIAIAGAFTVLGIAGALLGPLIPTILGLSAALAIVGVGILGIGAGLTLAGAGLSAIAIGIGALATSLAGGVTAIVSGLTVIVTGIAGLIPVVVKQLGNAIIVFCEVIAEGAPALGEAFKALLFTLTDVITECAPELVSCVLALLSNLWGALAEHTPEIVDNFLVFIIAVLDGVAARLPELIQSAVNLMMQFFSGITDALSGIDVDILAKGLFGVGLMAGIMAALSAVTALIPGAMVGVLGMGVIIAELALVLAAVGALAQIPGLDWLINEGGNLLQNIGTALGKFVGGIVGGIAEGVTSALPSIATDLSNFMTNLQPFLDGARMIDISVLENVKNLAGIIMALTAANLIDSLTSWFTGGTSLADFGMQLIPFGQAMAIFSAQVANIDETAVTAAANAGKILANMAETIPNTGGLISWFTGDNDLATFGTQLVLFGESIVAFSETVAGKINEEAIMAAASAASMLSTLANNLPESGGIVSWFTADNDMSTFGSELVKFGEAITEFSDEVDGIDIAALGSAITACKNLADMATHIEGVNFTSLSSFESALGKMGTNSVDKFVKAFEDGDSKVEKAVNDMVDSATDAIGDKSDDFNTEGSKSAKEFAKGIEKDAGKAETEAKNMAKDAADAIKKKRSSFYDAGEYLVKGFASGIEDNTFRAEAKAKAMAQAALDAAEAVLLIKSPSKATYKIGTFYGMGFVNSIDDQNDNAAKAGRGIAEAACFGLRSASDKIRKVIEGGIDTQPTIRPVLDTSSIHSGMNDISNIFGRKSMVGVNANISALSSSMRGMNQNGMNDDVISAINALRSELGNLSNTTYQINGVTYDDGSNITDAVRTIVRYAKIGGRV